MSNHAGDVRELMSLIDGEAPSSLPNPIADASGLKNLVVAPATDASPKARLAALLADPGRTPELIDVLEQLLETNPEEALAVAPALLGASPSVADFHKLIADARHHLEEPDLTTRLLKRSHLSIDQGDAVADVSAIGDFPGRDDSEIRIRPGLRKFEVKGDAAAWALTAIRAAAFRATQSKPTLPPHTVSPTAFTYPLRQTGDLTTVALFSDWGNGYYHAHYVAKQIAHFAPLQAVHLGDVYYTGGEREFAERFDPSVQKYLLPKMPLFMMNANHEMDSHGIAYLARLREKRSDAAARGWHPQSQEGSYFCLVGDRYQVIGIDTAYWRNGRIHEGLDRGCDLMREWLLARLQEGRDAGKINILLSQNEPYQTGYERLLRDLSFVLRPEDPKYGGRSLVDLWFWGDQHYCAIYPPTSQAPFIGSCIGHGGFPYELHSQDWFGKHVIQPEWGETGWRFEQRKDRGNNGFCLLEAQPDLLRLRYVDWRRNERCVVELPVHDGRLDWENRSLPIARDWKLSKD